MLSTETSPTPAEPSGVPTIKDLRDALEHIAKTAARSRTSTRRLRWIQQRAEWALAGRPYDDRAFDLPKYVGPETVEKLKGRVAHLQAKLAECQGKPRCATCLAMDAAYPGSEVSAC